MLTTFRLVAIAAVAGAGYSVLTGGQERSRRAPTTVATVPNFCRASGDIALTFDDGPAAQTNTVLNALKSNNVKATFHVTTKYINQVEVVTNVQRAFQEGHVIGLRYPTSLDPTQQSDDEIRTTLKDESAKIHTLIQQYPRYLRLPYGKFDDRVLAVAASLGFTVTAWNIDTNDYQSGLSAGEIAAAFSTPMSLIAPGTGRYIAVLHDVSPVYYDGAILQPTFNEIKNRQYKAVTLNTCLEENEAYRTTNDAAAMKGASWIAAPLAMVAALLM